jgi:hypothetical protein
MLWQSCSSEMFWEQRDYFVRLERCLCCGLSLVGFCRVLSDNQLTGTIPSAVGQLSSLRDL